MFSCMLCSPEKVASGVILHGPGTVSVMASWVAIDTWVHAGIWSVTFMKRLLEATFLCLGRISFFLCVSVFFLPLKASQSSLVNTPSSLSLRT